MPRVKGGTVTRQRRKKIMKLAKGYRGAKHMQFKAASTQLFVHTSTHSATVEDVRANSESYGLLVLTQLQDKMIFHILS